MSLVSRVLVSPAALIATSWGQMTPPAQAPSDLTDLAQTYCFSADGDHYATWDRARRDGFTELRPEDFPNLHMSVALDLRGFTRTQYDTEVRILTAGTWINSGEHGLAHYKLCWVSANPADRRTLDRDLQQFFGHRGFRQLHARVFAWIPLADGTERPVTLREFQRGGHRLSREQGMRLVVAGNVREMATVAYMVPTEDCEDWCYGSTRAR